MDYEKLNGSQALIDYENKYNLDAFQKVRSNELSDNVSKSSVNRTFKKQVSKEMVVIMPILSYTNVNLE